MKQRRCRWDLTEVPPQAFYTSAAACASAPHLQARTAAPHPEDGISTCSGVDRRPGSCGHETNADDRQYTRQAF